MTAHPPLASGTEPLTREGVHVLLVYGARIKVARDGRPGIRVTAGYHNGDVLLEAVGFDLPWCGEARQAITEAAQACEDAGLLVQIPPRRMSNYQARIVRRKTW